MNDLIIRRDRHAGRITFNRPQALNALSHEMVRAIHRALDDWRDDDAVDLVIIDAVGERAFCAGGDIAAMYHAGRAGDHALGYDFFGDEYRMNAALNDWPRPVVAFMQGFTMGGGIGVGGHASHRIVGDSTRMAMPEAGIGLIPDVGGSWLLARAPGHIGEYLALSAERMGPGDAIHAGLADIYLPEAEWPAMIEALAAGGDITALRGQPAPPAPLADADLSAFGAPDMDAIMAALRARGDDERLAVLGANSPLSMAAGLALVRAARGDARLQDSLAREYRFTARATEHSDFLEGVRARIIDKDRNPQWRADASPEGVGFMLAPLGPRELRFD
ncbi:MAG: enoyl-CoA hydratase/isomerase family protein [Paracoccus sp. (in: a-proteobacteria)]|nr:enoyl-CoA hydratase/isomerase family protein [Paracoccus sp. (in: a-proteobacteria)]